MWLPNAGSVAARVGYSKDFGHPLLHVIWEKIDQMWEEVTEVCKEMCHAFRKVSVVTRSTVPVP